MLFLPVATGKVQHFTESIRMICLTKFKKMIRFIINKKSNAVRKNVLLCKNVSLNKVLILSNECGLFKYE